MKDSFSIRDEHEHDKLGAINPFFFEEHISHLHDQRVIEKIDK